MAVRRHRRRGEDRGCPRHSLVGRTRLRRRAKPSRGRHLRHAIRLVESARALDPPPGRAGRPARAVGAAAGLVVEGTVPHAPRTKAPRRHPPPKSWRACPTSSSAFAGPVAPERFGVLQSLLAYLLAACGEEREGIIPAHELVNRFSIPAEQLEEHLSLLEPRQLRRWLLRGLRRVAR